MTTRTTRTLPALVLLVSMTSLPACTDGIDPATANLTATGGDLDGELCTAEGAALMKGIRGEGEMPEGADPDAAAVECALDQAAASAAVGLVLFYVGFSATPCAQGISQCVPYVLWVRDAVAVYHDALKAVEKSCPACLVSLQCSLAASQTSPALTAALATYHAAYTAACPGGVGPGCDAMWDAGNALLEEVTALDDFCGV